MFGSFLAPRLFDDAGSSDGDSGGNSGSSRTTGDKKKSGWRGGLSAAGSSLTKTGGDMLDRAASERITPSSYRKGGKVRKMKRKVKPRS
jgi:hypothetical protein